MSTLQLYNNYFQQINNFSPVISFFLFSMWHNYCWQNCQKVVVIYQTQSTSVKTKKDIL